MWVLKINQLSNSNTMKYIFIILSGMVVSANATIHHSYTEFVTPIITTCPEIEDKYIYYITAVLTEGVQNPEWKEMLSMQHNVNREEIESLLTRGAETPQVLQEYWQERGVEAVSDLEVCREITNTLENNEDNKHYNDDYKPLYYFVESKYLILYVFNQLEFSERNTPSPQIMDEHFRIIGELDSRMRRGN